MNRRAFTITEVMIAVLIVAACLAPIFFIFSKGSAGTMQTRDEVLAYNYATELLDYALLKPFDSPFLQPGEGRDANELEVAPTTGTTFKLTMEPRFQRKLSVRTPSVPSSVPFIYKVLVAEISWTTANIKHRISMTGMLYRNR